MSNALAHRLEFLEESEEKGVNTLKACCSEEMVEKFS
jgi:hypothetical protein